MIAQGRHHPKNESLYKRRVEETLTFIVYLVNDLLIPSLILNAWIQSKNGLVLAILALSSQVHRERLFHQNLDLDFLLLYKDNQRHE